MLYNLRMNIKNYNPDIGYKNVEITIIIFHILVNSTIMQIQINIWITTGKNLYEIKKKFEYHLLIDSPNKQTNRLIKTPEEKIFALTSK